MRIVFLQHGDYAEAYNRFKDGGGETYYAQRYSVDFVENLAEQAEFVGVCASIGDRREETVLKENLISIRLPPKPGGSVDENAVIDLLKTWRPTHLVLRTPTRRVLAWALRNKLHILPTFADSWGKSGPLGKLRTRHLAHLLNNRSISMVTNHNVPASLSLKAIGVSPAKIFPWDWPHELRPEDHPIKRLNQEPPEIVTIGVVSEPKGAGDCIEAANILKREGRIFKWRIIGAGPYEAEAKRQVEVRGLQDLVEFTGLLPHDDVISQLHAATISVVASRHAFPEGLPMTIYETLATRTPLVLSDHPMFQMFFKDQQGAVMAPEKSPPALAKAIASLLDDAQTYEAHSIATGALWARVKSDLSWGELVTTWIDDPKTAPEKLAAMALPKQVNL
jgi:glycosyltransferase involved in cell wall biosynthesis